MTISKTMKAAVLHAPGDLRVEEVQVPQLGADDVLVKVAACGVCGSDVPRILTTGTYHFPTIPGHEFSGGVAEAGKNSGDLLNKNVAVIPLIPCRQCYACSIGEFAQCKQYDFLGSRSDGGFAEYVKVPARNVLVLPEGIPAYVGSLLEPVTVALHAIQNNAVNHLDSVAVFGLGAIGNFVAQWARVIGAKVYAIDVIPEKVQIARETGLKDAVCSKDMDIVSYVKDATNGRGVDVAFDASGSSFAISQALKMLRPFGKMGLLGRVNGKMTLDEADFEKILRGQLTINGTWSFEMGDFPYNSWARSAQAMAEGKIIVDPLITHKMPIENTFAAVKLLASRDSSVHKILIFPDPNFN